MNKKWTTGQQNAIDTRGGSVLVSAAAGSGKTAVLVERVIGRITESDNPCDIDKLLIVTFTNLAAGEMKSRISARISELLRKNPTRHLRRQQAIIQRAHISTINSFCTKLIREHFDKLDLSSDFKVADEMEISAIKQICAKQAVEEALAEDIGEKLEALHDLLDARSDRGLISTVLRLYDFIRSHPFPEKFIQDKLAMYDRDINPAQSEWGCVILQYTKKAIEYSEQLVQSAYNLSLEDEQIFKAYGAGISTNLGMLKSLREKIDLDKNWDDIYSAIHSVKFVTMGTLKKYTDLKFKERVTSPHKAAVKILAGLKDIYCADSAEFLEDIKYLYDNFELLFSITMRFDKLYTEAKREKDIIDFSDAEHYTLKLLVKSVDNGAEKTPLADEISREFEEILIDEYQDVNEAQDTIFRALSRSESNVFQVGDVKQSIYKFRLAMPEIFLRKKKRYSDYDGENYPATIYLDRNFRSKRSVIGFVNFVFEKLMCDESVSEIKYDNRERLSCPEDCEVGVPTGIDILEVDTNAEGEILAQAEFVAKKIKEMLSGGHKISKGAEQVCISARDICILLR